jgi:hypothetical protein
VGSYTIAGGTVSPAPAVAPEKADSVRATLSTEIRERVPASALAGNPTDLLLVVYDAEGQVVLTKRLPPKAPNTPGMLDSLPFEPESIATVDVIKGGALLPAEAKGGLIRVTLKTKGPLSETRENSASAIRPNAGVSLRARTVMPDSALVVVVDSDGREVMRRMASTRAGQGGAAPLGGIPVDAAAIASMDVRGGGASSPTTATTIYITLKPGEKLRATR